jgi:surfactin synthase thioesterase subunit
MKTILLMVPFAGGNRYSLNYIRKCLPGEVQFTPLELPGRGQRINEPLFDHIPDMVDDLYAQTLSFPDAPYAIFGHCMGALLSILLVRRLATEHARLPFHIFAAGCKGPSALSGRRERKPTPDELKQMLVNSGTSPELIENESFFEMVEPIMRADLQGYNRYIYEEFPPLDLSISVIIDEKNQLNKEEAGLWQKETVLPVNIYRMPGMLKDSLPALSEVFKDNFSFL